MGNRERILAYKEANPGATLRQIQIALKLSSASLVDYHLKQGRYAGRPYNEIKRENEALIKRNKALVEALEAAEAKIAEFRRLGMKPRQRVSNYYRVKEYLHNNPDATVRQVMADLGLSSPSVAHHHMKAVRRDQSLAQEKGRSHGN